MTGELEPTNVAYVVAKIAGIKIGQSFRMQYGFDEISLMPINLYGMGDNFHPEDSHVIPSLIRKFNAAKSGDHPEVSVWGSGRPHREFLYADNLADAAVYLMWHYGGQEIINGGPGEDISISELAALVGNVVGYSGRIVYDASKPDGTPWKWLDGSRLHAQGWRAKTSLRAGIEQTYRWYLDNNS